MIHAGANREFDSDSSLSPMADRIGYKISCPQYSSERGIFVGKRNSNSAMPFGLFSGGVSSPASNLGQSDCVLNSFAKHDVIADETTRVVPVRP